MCECVTGLMPDGTRGGLGTWPTYPVGVHARPAMRTCGNGRILTFTTWGKCRTAGKELSNYLKYGIMVKRKKEVKIDEEQIRSMMAGDIPAAVMEKIYGDSAAGSKKEEDKGPETENQSGIPAVPDKVEDSGTSAGEEAPSPALREKARRKRNGLQEYPGHLFDNNVVKERRQTYVSRDNYERVRTLLSVIAPAVSISCYIDNILSAHLEQYRDELNAIYSSRINLKPL